MASQNYITSADITATVLKDFNTSAYINRTNDHYESLAISFDCNVSELAYPISPLAKDYLVNYCSMIIVQDKIGTNSTELNQDKYIVLHSIYNKETERLRGYLNYEVLTNEVDASSETSRTINLFRS